MTNRSARPGQTHRPDFVAICCLGGVRYATAVDLLAALLGEES